MTLDPYLRIEEQAPEGWRNEFMRCAIERFPRLQGAHVADILSILDDKDYAVGQIEALMESYESDLRFYEPGDVRIALLFAKIAMIDSRAVVYRLARKKEIEQDS